jgi:TonB-dependent receptor
VRYVSTDLDSEGKGVINGVVTNLNASTSYDFILPRLNINAELTEDTVLRAGIGKDIRRPAFDKLSPSASFGASASSAVTVGNPDLVPEENWSYDLSLEHYFSPSAFVSVGLFHKERDNLHVNVEEAPAEPIGAGGQIERDTTAPCEGGGIYNPNVPWENFNVFSSVQGVDGICVARKTTLNSSGTETQTGIELAAQYDLSEFEDKLGWASGFGVIANYTYQEAGGGLETYDYGSNDINTILGRNGGDADGSTATTADDIVSHRKTLQKLSENSYNITLFYDKHDLNVRMRYTWRDAFVEELGRHRFNIPPVVGARGQLNLSVSYDINETYNVGIEGINLTQEDRIRWCFNENTLLCEQSLTDRRVTLGLTAKF